MHLRRIHQRLTGGLVAFMLFTLVAIPAMANSEIGEQWGTYHWPPPTSGPLLVNVHNNTTGPWTLRDGSGKTLVTTVLDDWNDPVSVTTKQWQQFGFGSESSQPNVLRDGPAHTAWTGAAPIFLKQQPGSTASKTCKPSAGWIEVCNYAYGPKGWEGIAQIWTSRDVITQATAKLNDTYLSSNYYSAAELPLERQLVLCQELAHGFGLDHDDEDFTNKNTGTCMDYGNSPRYDEHPRWQDYRRLQVMYGPGSSTTAIATSSTTTAASEVALEDDPSDWGQVIERDDKGRPSHYRKDLGNGKKVFTFVVYPDRAQGVTVDPDTGADSSVDPGAPQSGQTDTGKTRTEDGKKHKGHSAKRGHGKHRR